MKKIIVPTGYMGSGSSAITDLISEFRDCQNEFKSYEYVLLHCPNGLFDFEDKLLIGNNAIRSDEAIRSFETQMKKLYNKKFWWVGNYQKIISSNFMKITEEYINNIQEFNFPGYWYTHEEVNTKMFFKLLVRKPLKILTGNKVRFNKILKYSDGMRISYVDSNKFYEESHKYIYKIIEEISKGKENIILDQFLLPFNLFRVDNYFDDKIRVIVVARDPRDVFITNKYILQQKQMRRLRFTMDDIIDALRQAGVFDISTVENAIVETNGSLSVQTKAECAPLTPDALGLEVEKAQMPITIVMDSKPVTEYFGDEKINENEIDVLISSTSLNTEDIMLLTIDNDGNMYMIERDRNV